jgi:hypothetical protein
MQRRATRGESQNFAKSRRACLPVKLGNFQEGAVHAKTAVVQGLKMENPAAQEPVNRIHRRVAAATAPHAVHIARSQMALENDEPPGIQVCSVHQGISAPMAKACESPRAKIAKITSGVGSTQYTIANSSVATNEPITIDSPRATAIAVTQINIHAKLNRNRRSKDLDRCG